MSEFPRHVAPTLVEAVRSKTDDRSRGFVFVRPDGTERLYSFGDIADEACRRGSRLRQLGMKKGDRLALVIPEGDEFVLSFLGALFVGIVPVPIVPQLSFKNVEAYHTSVAHVARASGASVILTSAATRAFVEPVRVLAADVRAIVSVADLAEGDAPRVDERIVPDDVAFLQFTSGSTSRPKGVVVTHANLAANAEAFMIHGIDRDPATDKGVSWLPLFHDMGLIGFVVGPLFTDIPCVFMPAASFVRAPRLWLDKIHEHRGTITYAPNFAYSLVAKRLKDREVEGLDLSCVRVAGCGAEPIQAQALRDFAARLESARFNPKAFLPSYGMAEPTLAITFVPHATGLKTDPVDRVALRGGEAVRSSDGPEDEIVDCGRAFPGHEVAVVDEAGGKVPDRRVGQIVTRGPSVASGYYGDAALTAETFRPLPGEPEAGPWLHTGDLGYLAGGHLFVCGRIKDIIIVRGRNYYPSDIEWAVSELPSVRRGNVVAFAVVVNSQGSLEAEGNGEERLVVCCEGAAIDAEAIRDAATARITAQFGLNPHEVVVAQLATLPRTSSGKPQRRKTRQMYLDGTLARARTVQGPERAEGGVQ